MNTDNVGILFISIIILLECMFCISARPSHTQYFIVNNKKMIRSDSFIYSIKLETGQRIITIQYADNLEYAIGDTLELIKKHDK